MWMQHILALGVVLGCVLFLGRRGWKSMTGGGCASGCGRCSSQKKPAPPAPEQRVVFLPVEMLARKK